tara:strand:- start:90 stop:575 length:486 start_codon:yes stop_codon:yes gene_type:complete
MTATKNVYALMLALVIVLSGCFGNTADDTDAQTPDETTDSADIGPEMIAVGGLHQGHDGGQTLFTFNTTSGQMVQIHEATADEGANQEYVYSRTTCIDGVQFETGNTISHMGSGHSMNKPVYLPGSFSDCTHEIYAGGGDNTGQYDLSWSMVYSIVTVTVG